MMHCYSHFCKLIHFASFKLALCIASVSCIAQSQQVNNIKDHLSAIEGVFRSSPQKAPQLRNELMMLKKEFEEAKLTPDSIYARLLNRISVYEYYANGQVATGAVIDYMLKALQINQSILKGSSLNLSFGCYRNLGLYYKSIPHYSKALYYLDSAISTGSSIPGTEHDILKLKKDKIIIYYEKRDYQSIIDESAIGVLLSQNIRDTSEMADFLSQKSQANYYLGQLAGAKSDADTCLWYATAMHYANGIADALKTKGLISAKEGGLRGVKGLLTEAIKVRMETKDSSKIADDLLDVGNFYVNDLKLYAPAAPYYLKALELAENKGDAERQSKAHLNLGVVAFHEHHYLEALADNFKALHNYHTDVNPRNHLKNPSAAKLSVIHNKELLLAIFNNKTEILLMLFKQKGTAAYLSAALQTAMLMDTLITMVRYEQVGELSKLYWREKTREFFSNALEASYLARDAHMAFLFMEKSRAVLLNDKINELGASSRLPADEAAKEQELKDQLRIARKKLQALIPNTPAYNAQQVETLRVQAALQHYLASLEVKHPDYYRYKYADTVVKLEAMQQYLAEHKQSFIHYFMNDSIYVLGIRPDTVIMYKLPKSIIGYEQVNTFSGYCSSQQLSDKDNNTFNTLANTLYEKLFQPLHIPKGRVIISPDNLILPFEVLSTDPQGKHVLLFDYIISYVYSARYLLNSVKIQPAEKSFVGFAPVSFQPYLMVPSLRRSADILEKAAGYYEDPVLYTGERATKSNFIQSLSGYCIVNVFSHAVADSSGREPWLYLQDSIIRQSDMPELILRSTSLIILSACGTNAGKNAIGEGVYSLARGFSSIGIPAVAATLWEADEESTYAITERFNHYLSQGMCKDSALQKSKIDFFRTHESDEKSYPFYWAGIIVTGDMQPVSLPVHRNQPAWLAGGIVVSIVLVLALILRKRKRNLL